MGEICQWEVEGHFQTSVLRATGSPRWAERVLSREAKPAQQFTLLVRRWEQLIWRGSRKTGVGVQWVGGGGKALEIPSWAFSIYSWYCSCFWTSLSQIWVLKALETRHEIKFKLKGCRLSGNKCDSQSFYVFKTVITYPLVSFLKKNPIFQKNWLQVKPHDSSPTTFIQLAFKFSSWAATRTAQVLGLCFFFP